MRIYETVATHRLEEIAARLGYALDIRIIEPHEDARFFVTAVKDVPKPTPAPLGWTDEEAIDSLRRRTWLTGRLYTL